MIIKSLIVFSIIFNAIGLQGMSQKLDDAVVRDQSSVKKVVEASTTFEVPLPEIMARPKIEFGAPKAVANAKEYILVDSDTGTVLAGAGKNVRVPIASTTKIMSAVVALENYKLDDVITVSSKATSQVPSVAYLRTGEEMTVENMLYCMLIPSGNDAAYAIAEQMNDPQDQGISKFIDKMNEKAAMLGMKDTHYEDPSGLSAEGYSSVYDLFLITRYAFKNPVFRKIVSESAWTAKNINNNIYHALKQSNRLITDNYPGAIGVKTGFTPEAGHCLVGAATRDGHTLISIVINTFSTSPSASADESRRLLDWGFANVAWH